MSGTVIITKFSLTNAQPINDALAQGEQAYSYVSGGGQKLWIGEDQAGTIVPIAIGGKFYTDQLCTASSEFGTLFANQALVVDSDKKIDVINIDNITIDGNAITTTNTNGNLTINPNGTGELNVQANTNVVGNFTVSGTIDIEGQTTLASLNVEDLTNNRVLIAGALGEVEDSANLTFDGTNLVLDGNQTTTGNTVLNGTLHVDGQSTLASLNVEDLTNDRMVFVGAGGELEDSADLTYDGATLYLNGASHITGTVDIDSQLTAASVNVEDLTINRVVYVGASGELIDSSNLQYNGSTLQLNGVADIDNIRIDGNNISAINTNGDVTITPDGDGLVYIDTNQGLSIASGSDGTRPSPVTIGDGVIRYNTTDNRFEGTVSGSWTGLGGVVDRDQDTYISAEVGDHHNFSALDDDTLRFVAAGTQEMTITNLGVYVTDQITTPIANITTDNVTTANIGTANVTTQLQVDADANFSVGIDVTAGDVDIADNLNVGGNAVIDGNLTVNGTTTTIESTVTTLNDPVIKVGDGSLAAVDLIDRGVNFDYGDGTNVKTGFFGFDNATNRFSFKPDVDVTDEDYDAPWGDAQFANLFLRGELEAGTNGNLVVNDNTITTKTGDLTITPAGGDTIVTGNEQVTGDLAVNGNVTFDNDVPVTSGGTGMSSFTGDAVMITNAAGDAIGFIAPPVSNPEDYVIKFNAAGVPVASNVIDGGTF